MDRLGLGANTGQAEEDDDEFDQYRKRMMLAYRFRPNPLVGLPTIVENCIESLFLEQPKTAVLLSFAGVAESRL